MGKRWERGRRRLVHRLSGAGPVGGLLAVLLSLGQARNSDCEDAFAETALAVDGVVSAEFDRSDMFGSGGTVVLRASNPVVDAAAIPERGRVDRRRTGGGRVPGGAHDP